MSENSRSESGAVGPPGPPSMTPPSARDRNKTAIIGGLVLLVVALVVALVVVVGGDSTNDQAVDVTAVPTTLEAETTTTSELETTTTTDPGFTQAEGEIFLEAAASEGPDSFAGERFVGEITTSVPAPTSSAAPPSEPEGPVTVSAIVGDTPALYGGSRDRTVCDSAAQLKFLENHPNKAAAFVAALNSDPNLLWSGGTSLTVAQLPEYFAELTPIVLTRDTRVTNHGYSDGQFTSRQVVLQAGSAVLVDIYGVPRARCLCGNPLTPPQPVQVEPVYTGAVWPDFNPDTIIVVNQTTVIIEVFVLVDIHTGEEFIRPSGSDGSADTVREASIWRIDLNATQAEADFFNTTSVAWGGEFTIADDGTISGAGSGSWTFDGDCFNSDGSVASTSSAQGAFTVALAGQSVTTELGRFLTIQPTFSGFAVASYAGNPPDAECEQDVFENVESWVAPSFTTIELQAEGDVVLAGYESGGFIGDVTLTPIG